jgi:hypothetical protein
MTGHLLAYIDPVSGVLLIQMVIGGCLGVVGFFRRTIWRALHRFARSLARARVEVSTVEATAEVPVVRGKSINDDRFLTRLSDCSSLGCDLEFRSKAA